MTKTVLLVEDSLNFADVVQALLRLEGFYPDVAEGVDEAIDRLRENNYDVVILDVNMHPGIFNVPGNSQGDRTGILFAEYIRLYFPKLPILIHSSYQITESDRVKLIEQGIAFLSKREDLDQKDLVSALQRALRIQSQPSVLDSVNFNLEMFGLTVDVKKFIDLVSQKWNKTQK